jgi:hypothetical protein
MGNIDPKFNMEANRQQALSTSTSMSNDSIPIEETNHEAKHKFGFFFELTQMDILRADKMSGKHCYTHSNMEAKSFCYLT